MFSFIRFSGIDFAISYKIELNLFINISLLFSGRLTLTFFPPSNSYKIFSWLFNIGLSDRDFFISSLYYFFFFLSYIFRIYFPTLCTYFSFLSSDYLSHLRIAIFSSYRSLDRYFFLFFSTCKVLNELLFFYSSFLFISAADFIFYTVYYMIAGLSLSYS